MRRCATVRTDEGSLTEGVAETEHDSRLSRVLGSELAPERGVLERAEGQSRWTIRKKASAGTDHLEGDLARTDSDSVEVSERVELEEDSDVGRGRESSLDVGVEKSTDEAR